MKKIYEAPEAEVIEINVEDVMTESEKFDLPEIPVGGSKSYKFD